MIIESLILLVFIGFLAAVFHFKIKHIAARPKPPEENRREENRREAATRLPASPGRSTDQSKAAPVAEPPPPQEPRQIDKLNQSNPKAVATMISQWVNNEPPPEPPKKTLSKRW